mmetsp:Transcript_10511/g.23934  ORF Transcript_10511/g.23934 Transcript_10511/m.23934 type:complete len:206 (+) Transcript_10511:1693-2310(+)
MPREGRICSPSASTLGSGPGRTIIAEVLHPALLKAWTAASMASSLSSCGPPALTGLNSKFHLASRFSTYVDAAAMRLAVFSVTLAWAAGLKNGNVASMRNTPMSPPFMGLKTSEKLRSSWNSVITSDRGKKPLFPRPAKNLSSSCATSTRPVSMADRSSAMVCWTTALAHARCFSASLAIQAAMNADFIGSSCVHSKSVACMRSP